MLSRRSVLLTPLILVAPRASLAVDGRMTLCLHTNTSAGAGYRGALEGWARAGIKNVELNAALVDEFLKTDPLEGARKVLADNGLTAVHGAVGVNGLLELGICLAEETASIGAPAAKVRSPGEGRGGSAP